MPRINVFYILETNLAVRRDRDGVTAAYGVKQGIFKRSRPADSIGRAALVGITRPGHGNLWSVTDIAALTNYANRINEH
jgi:hypothetical protein